MIARLAGFSCPGKMVEVPVLPNHILYVLERKKRDQPFDDAMEGYMYLCSVCEPCGR
jgi:hypothetical protein